MHTAVYLVTVAGALGSAWLCKCQMRRWYEEARAEGGPRYVRADRIYAASIIGSFFAGLLGTAIVLQLPG